MERPWVRRLVVGACAGAVALVVLGGGLKNRTEDCWARGAMVGVEYGESDLRLRLWPPGVECVGPDGAKLD